MRETNKRRRLMRRAVFPATKSVEDFDFAEIVMPEGHAKEEMLGLGFVEAAQDFVFYGKTGRGKMHLAIAPVYGKYFLNILACWFWTKWHRSHWPLHSFPFPSINDAPIRLLSPPNSIRRP